ncbi:hypothetical protein SAMN05661091_4940 [Paenibacillus uliginis N3/975]|uniref:Uncharacterized protein n=1 Tax=Paenibacillus uliginis N3/975 TaxID=1313296 RepID=A0A1X7HPD4_9BACL|nr:hypothetical protein SAMN05661091_4940 [Paenibacillus uliginis N3/975]
MGNSKGTATNVPFLITGQLLDGRFSSCLVEYTNWEA